ncbi:dynein regulatory complex subunit 2 [Parambassis ranga]|uniref:Dynein regulatory complex subunit 2 n=1 Tax=Parambassis ranga TaxID=210632 RepID=A0A6P7JLW4_9TELE|nr:dynein regulatory complex subunit 2 [Parambassis ranga]
MPKKAKKGGGQTEEQRLVQQQQRAQAEEEMAKKKEEMLALFLQDKLQKEQRNSAVNLLKLHVHWRTILRQSRSAELREDMDVHRQAFERELDNLDSITKKLVCDLQDVERHETQVQRCHMQHLDQLREQQAEHLRRLQQQWDGALQEVNLRIHTEREQIVSGGEQQQQRLQDLTALIQERDQEKMDAIHTLYITELDQYEEEDTAAAQLEELLLKDMQALSASRRRQRRAADHKAVRRDPRNPKKTQRDKLSCIQTARMHQDLFGAREEVTQKFYQLQDHMSRTRAAARKQFSQLTVQSDAAAKELQAVIFKGEKVLRAADMCCRLEGVLCSPLSSSSSSSHPAGKHTAAKVCDDMASLTHRLNDALQLRGALRTQAEELSSQNQQLQLLLQQHGAALDGHPAPLYGAPVPTTTAAPAPADRGRTVIEAAHVFKYAQ